MALEGEKLRTTVMPRYPLGKSPNCFAISASCLPVTLKWGAKDVSNPVAQTY
jgi:hypothetical protein